MCSFDAGGWEACPAVQDQVKSRGLENSFIENHSLYSVPNQNKQSIPLGRAKKNPSKFQVSEHVYLKIFRTFCSILFFGEFSTAASVALLFRFTVQSTCRHVMSVHIQSYDPKTVTLTAQSLVGAKEPSPIFFFFAEKCRWMRKYSKTLTDVIIWVDDDLPCMSIFLIIFIVGGTVLHQ